MVLQLLSGFLLPNEKPRVPAVLFAAAETTTGVAARAIERRLVTRIANTE